MDDEFEIDDEEEQELEDTDYADGDVSTMDKVTNFLKENKKLVIIAVLVIVLLILMSLFSSSSDDGVTISSKTLTITTETSGQLNLLKDGKNVTNVQWESKDPSIATVDKNGMVKGVKVGKTTVTGTYNKRKHECEVTVTEGDTSIKVEKVTISDEGIILMPVGTTYEVPIQVSPSEALVKSKIFSSTEPNVASIDMETGVLTANAIGETTIRVTVNDGEAQTNIKARVINGQIVPGIYVLPTSLSFDEKEITLTEGETKMLTYRQEPATASTDYILWTSSDEEIATVLNGELVARKAGNVEISISSLDLRDTMVVHVLAGEVPVTGINLESETNITMEVGEQKQIVATVEPSNATNQVITYLVDNPTVLSVDSSGTISAFGSGSTIITVSPSSNLDIKRLIYVTVNEPYNPPDDPTDPGGGGGTPTKKVGSVVITGTNNAVSTDVNGNEVDSTKITLKGSGNVDEIRFCFYNKATSSTCSYSIYTDEFTLPPSTVTAKTVYVIKAIPYYQGQEGTEETRYVTIKGIGGGSTPTIGYKVTSNNLYNNPGTANSYAKTGDQTVSFDIVNGGVSYLKVCLGDNCTPSTKVLDNGVYNITTRGMITVRVSEYNAANALVRGPDNWYIYIPDEAYTNACYCNSSGACRWGLSGNGYTILTDNSYTVCKKYIDRGNVGCFLHNGSYTWGSYLHNPTNYAYVSTIEKQSDCGGATPDRCYCNGSGNCVWGQKDSTHTNDVTSVVGETACKAYINRGNKGCFRIGSTANYEWGSFLGISNYVLMSSYTTSSSCPTSLVLKDTSNTALATSINLLKGNTKQIYLYVNGTKKTTGVTWTSSKTSVATVSNGLITIVSTGTVRITATYNGKSTYVDIVASDIGGPSRLEFRNQNNIVVGTGVSMIKGTEEQLFLYVNGAKKTSGVTWTSSKTTVATVSNGLVKAVGAGKARITAYYNGESTFIDLEVPNTTSPVGTISVTGNGLTTTKPTINSSSVSATTIRVSKTGNVNKIKYCRTTASTCTPSTELAMNSSEITVLSNFSTEGIHMFVFEPYYNTTAGPKITRYVYIKKQKTDPVCPTITSYSGTYDGNSHTISLSSSSGGTLEYRTSSTGTWSTTKPTRTEVGTTNVYVRIKGDSLHNDKECGSGKIEIKEKVVKNAISIRLYKDGVLYASSGQKIALYKNGSLKYSATASSSRVDFENVESGTYYIYAGVDNNNKTALKNTNIMVTTTNGEVSRDVHYYTLSVNVRDAISSLTINGKQVSSSVILLGPGSSSSNYKHDISANVKTTSSIYRYYFSNWTRKSGNVSFDNSNKMSTKMKIMAKSSIDTIAYSCSEGSREKIYGYDGDYDNRLCNNLSASYISSEGHPICYYKGSTTSTSNCGSDDGLDCYVYTKVHLQCN